MYAPQQKIRCRRSIYLFWVDTLLGVKMTESKTDQLPQITPFAFIFMQLFVQISN